MFVSPSFSRMLDEIVSGPALPLEQALNYAIQIADALAAAGATPAQLAALQAVMDKAKANNDKLADAVTANTPAA